MNESMFFAFDVNESMVITLIPYVLNAVLGKEHVLFSFLTLCALTIILFYKNAWKNSETKLMKIRYNGIIFILRSLILLASWIRICLYVNYINIILYVSLFIYVVVIFICYIFSKKINYKIKKNNNTYVLLYATIGSILAFLIIRCLPQHILQANPILFLGFIVYLLSLLCELGFIPIIYILRFRINKKDIDI